VPCLPPTSCVCSCMARQARRSAVPRCVPRLCVRVRACACCVRACSSLPRIASMCALVCVCVCSRWHGLPLAWHGTEVGRQVRSRAVARVCVCSLASPHTACERRARHGVPACLCAHPLCVGVLRGRARAGAGRGLCATVRACACVCPYLIPGCGSVGRRRADAREVRRTPDAAPPWEDERAWWQGRHADRRLASEWSALSPMWSTSVAVPMHRGPRMRHVWRSRCRMRRRVVVQSAGSVARRVLPFHPVGMPRPLGT